MKIELFRKKITFYLSEMKLISDEAILVHLMLAGHESLGAVYMRQLGGGPARGPYGMEEYTHDSIWDNCDSIKRRAKALGIKKDFSLVETDLRYATFMARMYLIMDKNPLPEGYIACAHYCKSYWNRTGKATPEEYMRDYVYWERGLIG